MAQDQATPTGPDLTKGIPLSDIEDGGKLVGHVGGDQVLLVRRGAEVLGVDAACTHYHGPLGEGLVVGDTVRCPWHHARFDLRTGEAVRAPAIAALSCWNVEQRDGRVFVREKRAAKAKAKPANQPSKIVIVGGGAAGFAAAEMLRREQYQGSIVMLSSDDAAPVDRPNLSKDYLAGNAPEEWLPIKPDDFYAENKIDLRLKANVAALDTKARQISLANGESLAYDKLLLATGAEPIRLQMPGMELPHVFTLRTTNDCRAIIARASGAKRAVVLGASFIGLEVAASLRNRGIEVHVAAPEKVPMERVLGPEMGAFVRALHEEHGVIFHLGETATAIDAKKVTFQSGRSLEADFVVAGVGVRPRIQLAEKAGLQIDRGVVVNSLLQTSAPDVFAAGDIARWPDPHSRANIRVEHWVVAETQGQTAARNMLGRGEAYDAVPFFWSQHYDVPINYVGHAEKWDAIEVDGDIKARDCLLRYKSGGRTLAVTSIYRDVESLKAELAMERAARV